MSDNSALQCIGPLNSSSDSLATDTPAVILPRVQIHFDLSSKVVGLLSASTMAGVGHNLLRL